VARVEKLIARARALDARTVDYVLAACLAMVAAGLLAGTPDPFPGVLLGILGATTVATRRRAPALSILAIAATSGLIQWRDPGAQQITQALAAALCFYTLGRSAGRRSAVIDFGLLGLALPVMAVTPPKSAGNTLVGWLIFGVLTYVGGRIVDSRVRLTHELEANAERARREQETRARQAAADERTRIARELHDVIAHSLSVMVIQTVAAREVAGIDQASARAALAAVQLAGREALLEMRRMIGVLRHGDVELAGSAAPGLDQLDLLAQRARMSGLPVTLTVVGGRRQLPEALDLVAFRIVQEALTNSIKHAGPARASVTVTFRPDTLELEICDDGQGVLYERREDEGRGHGLVGMRERLALFDGVLSTGRQPGGGFRVYARLPVAAVAAG
jgi:signal transduction histidine kinase